LKPDIRLFVPRHNGAQTVQDILKAARISEVGHSADTTSSDHLSEMASNLKQLPTKLATSETEQVTDQLSDQHEISDFRAVSKR
jgi:hypothetical protein